jgi:hypothetical protein
MDLLFKISRAALTRCDGFTSAGGEHLDWSGNVLDHLFASIFKVNVDLAFDLFLHLAGDANASRIRKRLKPSRDIDAVAKQISLPEEHIPDVDPDPEPERTAVRMLLVFFSKRVLHLESALDSIHHAWKFCQHAIACRIGNPPAMSRNEPVHDLTVSHQGMKGANLVSTHQS